MNSLNRLSAKLDELRARAESVDQQVKKLSVSQKARLYWFSTELFTTDSLELTEYIDETQQQLNQIKVLPGNQEDKKAWLAEQVAEKVSALVNLFRSVDIKLNSLKFTPRKKKPVDNVYKQAAQKIMASGQELYSELSQHHEFERRLNDMIVQRQIQLDNASDEQQLQLRKEVMALHQRLSRCRKAISGIEEKIDWYERKESRKNR